jgi:hypothetical protein
VTTQTLQQTLTKAWRSRIGRLVGVSFSLVLLFSVVMSYHAANTYTTVDSTALGRSGLAYDGPSDELLPKCMIHVCVQRLAALNADGSMDEPIPECMVHICVSRSAAPSADVNMDALIPDCMIHVCVQPLAVSSADRSIDMLLPECMIHVCVQPLAASVYDGG